MLVNLETKKLIPEHEFFLQYPTTSFPSQLSNAVLKTYGYATVQYDPQPSIGKYEKIVQNEAVLRNGAWVVTWTVQPLPSELIDQIKSDELNRFGNLINERLDDFARSSGYFNITTMCSYSVSKNEKFKTEGLRAVELRDQTWEAWINICNEISEGTRPFPSEMTDFIQDLPELSL